MGIRQKLILLVAGHLLLFFILVSALFFWFQSALEDKVSVLAQQTMETLIGNMDVYLGNTVRLSNSIASDSSLSKLLRETPDFAAPSTVWPLIQLSDKLKGYSFFNQTLYSIGIYNPKSGKVLSTADGIYDTDPVQMEWASRMLAQNEPLMIGADLPGALPPYRQGRLSVITVIQKLSGKSRENLLLINFNKQVLDLFVGKIELWKGTGIVISDPDGNPLYTAGDPLSESIHASIAAEEAFRQPYEVKDYQGKSYLAVRKQSESTDWVVRMIIPYTEIMKDVLAMKRVAVIILLVIALFMLLLFHVLYLQIFNPIKRLIEGMLRVEKGLAFRPVPIKRMDELGFLQQRFNDMVQNEQQMRREILEEKLHKREIELKFLQSQVNPHFLYNTLDSIYWVAEQSGVDEISDVVLDLSQFFRLSLSRGKEFVTVEETIEHLKSYLRIQQFRHTDKFEVQWDVEPDLLQVRIVKLMLQPVVENAIVHGLEKAAGPCRLTVRIRRQGEYLNCSVGDTGIGMGAERVKRLLDELKRESGPSDTTYGLRNLYQRLKILYGDDMDLQIDSKPGEGTVVTIRIRLDRLGGAEHEHEGHHRGG
ncbi:histidine kinase [Paenibacillus sp. 32O-W]|uniref:cache domain-containing sensor histidine kinase n=1 Tax=Paenibacillus sp. 32O-W TaxID=1695218 RepID=UPI000721A1A3|nr:sensor histidine kinase [Paenibacillus sp. 32O-W]ALS26568.1 histidine kinase [Paenibacillus sp. 32O-W]